MGAMKVIVLAAGLGSRLHCVGSPKPLTLLSNGKSLLGFQLEQIAGYISLSEVIVVVGHKQEKIRAAFPQLKYVENSDYATQNTSKSLLLALHPLKNEDVLWLNGDVIFHQRVLKPLFAQRSSCMVVNRALVGQEEVKYRTDSAGFVVEVSKQVQDPEGEAVGIHFFSAADLPMFKQALEDCENRDYFEKGIEICIRAGCKVATAPIPKADCIEIDFPADLEAANELLRGWR